MIKVMHNKNKYILLLITAFLALPTSSVFADSNDVDFSITVNPSLTLALSSNTVNFSITPTAQGAYNSANFTVTSATNNAYGYTLVMGTSNVDLTSNTINPTTGTNPIIPTLTETQDGISAVDFEASTDSNVLNHYGVAIGTGNNFNAMKTTKQVKKTTTNNASGVDNTVITLASKLDLNTVPGTYSTTINFQMTANPVPGGLEEAYQSAGKTKTTINGKEYYAMQDMTTEICNNVTLTGDVIEVYDKRDNAIYRIGKLADNRCWLLDDLALDLTNTDVKDAMYDSSDSTHDTMTNATNTQLGYLFNGGRVSGDATTDNLPTAGVANWTSSYSYSAPLVNMASKNIEPTYDEYEETDEPLAPEVRAGHWKVGVYYNYCAASAGSYCYDAEKGIDKDTSSAIDANQDICPANWRMPTGGPIGIAGTTTEGGGEYQLLANAITGGDSDRINTEPEYSNFRKALRLPLSGTVNCGLVGSQGSYGGFWSSTYDNSYNMYFLSVDTWGITPQDVSNLDYGRSIRCIAR